MIQNLFRSRLCVVSLLMTGVTVLVLVGCFAHPAYAGGGIVLYPPFDGTYRVTAYFDHESPNYGDNDNIRIYNGEQRPANSQNDNPCCTGDPYPYDGHDGWDWSMGTTNILAAASGTIASANTLGCYGTTIIINHTNGYHTMYSHLSQSLVQEGDLVTAGQHIGESGNSVGAGCSAVPAHLHFGVRHGANWDSTAYAVDPFGWRGSGRDPLYNFNQKESSCLWAGVPGDGISCSDIIVEDDGAGWAQYPSWDNSCEESITSWARCDQGNGFRYHWTNVWDEPDFSVSWRPWDNHQLRYPGYYQIHAFIPATNGTTNNALYQVRHNVNNLIIVPVDQLQVSDDWAPLGQYRLWPQIDYVSLDDYTGEGSQSGKKISADAMKFSASIVHLPDVKNYGGWTSSIIIRNNSASSAQVAVNYYNSSGSLVNPYQTATIAGNGSTTKTPPSGFSGSAVVVASQDVSVVVDTHNSDKGYAYVGIPHHQAVSGIGAATEVFVPNYLLNYYGWSSTLYVQNTGSTATTVHAYLYNASGSVVDHRTAPVNAGGQTTFNNLSGVNMGSVRLTADQPIAVVVHHDHGDMIMAYVGSTGGGARGYLPSLLKNYYGWTASYQSQEVTGNNVSVSTLYYPAGINTFNLNARGLESVYMGNEALPDGWMGSAVGSVTSGNGQIVTSIHHASSVNALGYHGFNAGARDLSASLIKKNTGGWDASLTIQNVGIVDTQVTVRFYSANGTEIGNHGPFVVQSGRAQVLYGEIPNGISSALIHSDGANVVAAVHHSTTDGPASGYGVP